MKKSDLIEEWKNKVRVASAAEINTQHHSPRDISLEDAARGWLAYKELYQDNKVFINRYDNTYSAVSFYKDSFNEPKKGLIQAFKDRNRDPIADWAAQNPHNLLLVYRTGADIMKSGTASCLSLSKMHLELAETKGMDAYLPNDEQSKEIFSKLFHRQDEAHAIELMGRTAEQRTRTVLNLDHSY
tara:strand:- start:233 stop:787 length:555 start_codon:yes stop_codon:yes gene_type:complete